MSYLAELMNVVVIMRDLLVSQCLGLALSYQENMSFVLVPPNTLKLIEVLRSTKFDLMLIDVELRDGLAVELTRIPAQQFPTIKTIVIGGLNQESRILECIEAGANGFFLKEASITDLVETIYMTLRGEAHCSPHLAFSLFSRLFELSQSNSYSLSSDPINLSQRELQVLRLVADGLGNKQIAQQLNLSLHTIKNHVHNILEKLSLNNRSEVVSFAINQGLVPDTNYLLSSRISLPARLKDTL